MKSAFTIWYRVRDVDDARAFYRERLGFEELYYDEDGRWATLTREGVQIAVAEGAGGVGESEAVAALLVNDVKAERQRLREAAVDVGIVLELAGSVRILDVFDLDGNRVQLTQDI